MINLKKWIFLALFLWLLYFIFIANFVVTFSIIFGLIIAFKLYKYYYRKKLNRLTDSKELFKESELGLFVALVAKVAKADGRVSELEAQLIGMMFDDICSVFVQKDKARGILKEIFNEAKQKEDDTKDIARILNNKLGKSRLKRRKYVGFLIQLAFVDSGIGKDEDEILRIIVNELGMSYDEYKALASKFESMMRNKQGSISDDEAYKILGVNKSDDMSTIKKAYRKLVREYHPDIIKSQDKDEAYIEEATAKTQEINQAYEHIKKIRGS
jgi:DnaJ like chaperone protein